MVSDSMRKLFLSIQLLLHPGSLTAGLTRSRAGAKTTEGSGLDSLRVYYRKLLHMRRSQDYLETHRGSSRVMVIHNLGDLVCGAGPEAPHHCPPSLALGPQQYSSVLSIQARSVMVQSLRTPKCLGTASLTSKNCHRMYIWAGRAW